MYYNYGQSLQKARRLDDAAAAALARREVWKGNGERLLGVAAELAAIDRASHEAADDKAQRPEASGELADEIITTLRQAHDSGLPSGIDLATDQRFAYLKSDKDFGALMDEVGRPAPKSTITEAGGLESSSTKN
jgi:hypothetical protein